MNKQEAVSSAISKASREHQLTGLEKEEPDTNSVKMNNQEAVSSATAEASRERQGLDKEEHATKAHEFRRTYRLLYARLISGRGRNHEDSKKIIAFWNFLHEVQVQSLYSLMSLKGDLLDIVADGAMQCLRGLQETRKCPYSLFVDDKGDISLGCIVDSGNMVNNWISVFLEELHVDDIDSLLPSLPPSRVLVYEIDVFDDNMFHHQHYITRRLYARLIFNLVMDAGRSRQIVAFWNWLELEGCQKQFLNRLLALEMQWLRVAANEAAVYLAAPEPDGNNHEFPLTKSICQTEISSLLIDQESKKKLDLWLTLFLMYMGPTALKDVDQRIERERKGDFILKLDDAELLGIIDDDADISPPIAPQENPIAEDAPIVPNSILFIQNLSLKTTTSDLQNLFQEYEGFKRALMMEAKPGIAFAEFCNDMQSSTAMENLQDIYSTLTSNRQNRIAISFAKK